MKSSPKIKMSNMLISSPREHWTEWADKLHRYQLDGLVSWLLEAGRPLVILSAQMLYMGRPFLGDNAEALAHTLESDDEVRAFTAFLDGGRLP